ncbi:glycosyltransferase family 2 protein [Microvirga massiliensis]|uniref:glycosyltransferase family 2 protein n=1 Tax=Microvirga massiliensis TaxID=1033741 RepID=UPI0006607DEB|nr:glycosyltransferase family 2 protein [Microvirga massiliensis]
MSEASLPASRLNITAAGVVAFGPDRELLLSLVRTALEEVAHVYVFVNALIDEALLERLLGLDARCHIIQSDHNLGVAEALNLIALHAILAGCSRAVLFDQDSRPPQGMVSELGAAMDLLQESGQKVAVVGPAIVAPAGRTADFKSPRYFQMPRRQPVESATPVRYVITSGSLVDLGAFRTVGKFRSDFFIDAIDTEWCFRAWDKGYSCWFVPNVRMAHTIGEGAVRSRLFGLRFPHQSPMRMYSYFRNQVASLGLAHVPLNWKLRFGLHVALLATTMLIDAKFSPAVVGLIRRAVADGMRGRLGPPPGAARTVAIPT